MNFIGCVRNFIYAKNVEKGRSTLPWIIFFCIIMVAVGILTWASPISLIPLVAKILSTIAYGIKNTRAVRLLTLPTSLGWLVYDAVVDSDAGVINEIFTSTSILIAIVRFDILKREKK